jgi:hypothetical protein
MGDAAAAAAADAKAAEERHLADEADTVRRADEQRLRDATLDEYESAHEAIWAQATAVVNVKALIPRRP